MQAATDDLRQAPSNTSRKLDSVLSLIENE